MHKKINIFVNCCRIANISRLKYYKRGFISVFLKAGIFVHFYPKSNKADPKAGVSFEWSHH